MEKVQREVVSEVVFFPRQEWKAVAKLTFLSLGYLVLTPELVVKVHSVEVVILRGPIEQAFF